MHRFARMANAPALSGRLICMQERHQLIHPHYERFLSSHCACSRQRQGRQCSSAAVFPTQKYSAAVCPALAWSMQACESHQASNRAKRANLSACMAPTSCQAGCAPLGMVGMVALPDGFAACRLLVASGLVFRSCVYTSCRNICPSSNNGKPTMPEKLPAMRCTNRAAAPCMP